jgi:hypothetical protein
LRVQRRAPLGAEASPRTRRSTVFACEQIEQELHVETRTGNVRVPNIVSGDVAMRPR